MQQAAGRPPGRYGNRPDRLPWPALLLLAVLGAAFLSWVGWAAIGAASRDAPVEVTAFRVFSAAEIEVRVAAPSGAGRLVCSLQALDRTREVVGVGRVALDGDSGTDRERWVTVRTRDRAVTATVEECSPPSEK